MRAPSYYRVTTRAGASVLLGVTPKVAMTSIRAAMEGSPLVPQAEAAALGLPILLFVREPLARFKSAWRFVEAFVSGGTRRSPVPFDSRYESFADAVLDGRYLCMHTRAQSQAHEYGGRFLPTRLERLEAIAARWPAWFDRALPHENRSSGVDPGAYRERELLDFYAGDALLWEGAG